MADQRILFPQWRDQNETTNYPFAQYVTLSNGMVTLLEGTLIDAALYPIGGGAQLRLSQVVVTHQTVTVYIGDNDTALLASGQFSLTDPPYNVGLVDVYNRPAGVLISEPQRLGLFASWGVGTFTFESTATEFAATVCFPTPQIGIRGIQLADGTVLTGQVWLVGGLGVQLSHTTVYAEDPATGGNTVLPLEVIRVDVVGDPLYLRALSPTSLFQTPQFLKTLTFQDSKQTVICGPDEFGDVKILVGNNLAADTALRVHPTAAGTKLEVVGSLVQGA
jgi:hypothetical protein